MVESVVSTMSSAFLNLLSTSLPTPSTTSTFEAARSECTIGLPRKGVLGSCFVALPPCALCPNIADIDSLLSKSFTTSTSRRSPVHHGPCRCTMGSGRLVAINIETNKCSKLGPRKRVLLAAPVCIADCPCCLERALSLACCDRWVAIGSMSWHACAWRRLATPATEAQPERMPCNVATALEVFSSTPIKPDVLHGLCAGR
mmetsp:Transcript_123624/g.357583  ORF Transcript_123624/g.357583 Transcript_123624/m.357583 type:complete len:201 (-) Transcript_123624:478-1080(-)